MTSKRLGILCLLLVLAAGSAAAQTAGPLKKLTPGDVYCSGMVTNEAVPSDLYLISGEESNYQTVYAQGDYVYINRGSSGGVKVGDRFSVMRAVKDSAPVKWFEFQQSLRRVMGTQWVDLGHVEVVHVESNVSVAKVKYSCDYVQRGDIVRPFAERPIPDIRPYDGNHFPATSGKQQAMVVSAKGYINHVGAHQVMYVNMGSAQGVKVGDMIRIFRYQGTRQELVYQMRWTAYKMWGFGKTPVPYGWKDLPRELLGEGVVLNVSGNAAAVFIAHNMKPIFTGDYVEIE